MKKYSNLQVILPGCQINNRLPIICINIKELHYNFIVALLSDIYGIQSRGGVSCTNLLAELIETKYNIKGWVRISFNWLMTKEQIDYIIKAVEYILNNVDKYKNDYVYDKKKNLYTHKKLTI